MSTIMPIRRTVLATIGAAAVLASASAPAHAVEPSADTKIAAAVEALRAAMVAGDGRALTSLVTDSLTYGHSDGRVQDKTDFIESLADKNAFKSIDLSKQTVTQDGDVAWVRHVFDAVNNLPGGKVSTSHISVLQVRKRDNGAWKLFARQAAPLKA